MRKFISLLTIILISSTALLAQKKDTNFGVKGFYLDARAEVITMDAMYDLIDDMAGMGLNALLMEWEATFPFERHATLSNEFVHSKKEVVDFVAYAAEKGVDIIPLQNCFGHSEYILRHNRYYNIREDKKEVSMVCPLKHEAATPIFKEIFEEVAALHPSKYFHIGADETFILGSCPKCKEIAESEEGGKSRLFVDYVNEMVKIVKDMGKIPIIWADIILKYPEAVNELDKDLIFVDWNYGWDLNRFGDLQHLYDADIQLWGAPSLRSGPDNMYITMWDKHFKNLVDYVPHARKNGYEGMIQTSWSTSGGYGFHYDASWEVLSMQTIRLVYPTIAFNVLLEAYAEAVNYEKPLDVDKFLIKYARERFGVSKKEAKKFYNYMTMPQWNLGRNGVDKNGTPVAEVIAYTEATYNEFLTFEAKENQWEVDHLSLMLEIRLNWLRYKQIEAYYDSKKFSGKNVTKNVHQMADRMEELVAEAYRIDERFKELNKEYLKDGQWKSMFDAHAEKLCSLSLRLRNLSNNLK